MTHDIQFKILKIQTKYQAMMNYELGQLFGYPQCCIAQFVKEVEMGINSGQYRLYRFNKNWDTDHIPCDKCMKKI